jgi:hypothetical protein
LKRTIKVSAGFSGKIATGSFQNMNPSFFAEETFEIDDGCVVVNDLLMQQCSGPNPLKMIKERQIELQAICYANFEQEAHKAKIRKIQEDRKDFRWYGEYPSVTSILGYDADFFVEDNDLKQYASQGNIIHAQVAEFIKTGEWKSPDKIEGTTPDLFILKTGSLSLSLDGWDFPAFLKKYPLTGMKNGNALINDAHQYGGTYDLEGIYSEIPTLCDVKRTTDKVKNLMQMAAYSKCSGMEHIKQIMVIPLNDKTDQGFSKPTVSVEIDKYFELFIAKRKEFKKVYGI